VIRQIKNGQTIFDTDVMKLKYSNPYFKNKEMHGKLLEFLHQRKPKEVPNPNINTYDDDQLPIPDKSNQTQAKWL